jgi:hypothetical protein
MVATRETSRCSEVFHATIADFGAFSLGYRRVVALPVMRRNRRVHRADHLHADAVSRVRRSRSLDFTWDQA